MYKPRRKVLWFAIVSRLAILILQFVFNILCPDHHADAFKTPLNHREKVTLYDNIVRYLFSGLTRWDGEYFLHIAKYGYTYENTLAFYPLYPMLIRIAANFITSIFFILNIHSATIIAALSINFLCFIKSAIIFYDLSKAVLNKTNAAYKAAILYCINPANIFFSGVYSESLFAYLTFYSMFRSIKFDLYVSFPLGLSSLVRSNGLVNVGFPLYLRLRNLFRNFSLKHENYSLKTLVHFLFKIDTLQSIFAICNIIIISVVPFILLQIYNYIAYCIPNRNQTSVPLHVVSYGIKNNLILPSNGSIEWCQAKIPIAYSYIQKKYWNVGFLNYYELKQIPNFILALPVLYVMIVCIKEYFFEHKKYFFTLGFVLDTENRKRIKSKKYPVDMFVFIIHGLFLTVFCILFVHIQVSTRLICSASPLIYWYCALTTSHASDCDNESNLTYEDEENQSSKWKVFLFTQKKFSLADKFILSYFLGYTILGCFMFANYLPWT